MNTSLITFSNSPVLYPIEVPELFPFGSYLVVETQKGLELAKVVKEKYENEKTLVADENENTEEIKFVKVATTKEIEAEKENLKIEQNIKEKTREIANKLSLEMKISGVKLTLDKSKASIYFTSENRVDFRELVKELASTFKTRIELRQIGSRDETRLMGGFGICGKECCCKQFLSDFEHVSVKMAKNQNLSINPTKISGICGRLLCCLEYENEHYAETNKLMPKVGSQVETPSGLGKVVYNDLLKRIVQVKIGDENSFEIKNFDLSEIKQNNKDKKWYLTKQKELKTFN